MKYFLISVLLLFNSVMALAQKKQVAITMDDVPNTRRFKNDGYNPILLNRLDSMQVPVAIFINESKIYRHDSTVRNFALFHDWVTRPYVTLGNHTYSHPRYSAVGFKAFSKDIDRGECITRELADKYKKPLRFFRFPFNDLGKDSLEHDSIKTFLKEKGYTLAPHTVESSDWLYDYLYGYYLEDGEPEIAKAYAEKYIEVTLENFAFFDSVAHAQYGRDVKHIYLCHDNLLNAHYLHVLLRKLEEKGYSFITLEEAISDPIYQQEDHYKKKWGISWLYRWMADAKARMTLLRKERNLQKDYELYEDLRK